MTRTERTPVFQMLGWLGVMAWLTLVGCLSPLPVRPQATQGRAVASNTVVLPVTGRVDWSGTREVQAAPSDVVGAATVSFIELSGNTTVVTGRTDAAGAFSLNLGTFAPATGGVYLLEAVKGLSGQAPGKDAARFRTFVSWTGSGWTSMTAGTTAGPHVINALTTALAIQSALDPTNVAPANTINKVNVSTSPPSLRATPVYTNHPDTETNQLASDLITYLGADLDPVASVPAILPSLSSFTPSQGPTNSLLRIEGRGFSPVPAGNSVTIGGAQAQVLVATPTTLVVVVPANASTGTVRIQTSRGSVQSTSNYTVIEDLTTLAITDITPTVGRVGSSVMLSGNFNTPVAPAVVFPGPAGTPPILARVTSWTPASMTVTVPLGSTTGTIGVRYAISSAASLATFQVTPGNVNPFVNMSSSGSATEGAQYTLPDAVYGHTLTTYTNSSGQSFVYLLGGSNTTNYAGALASVRMYPVNADASLGSARTMNMMTNRRLYAATWVAGNYLYVAGGVNQAGTALTSIERASIASDGTLGAWSASGLPALSVARWRGDAIAIPSADGTTMSVYILGGTTNAATAADALTSTWNRIVVTLATNTLVVTSGTLAYGATNSAGAALPTAIATYSGNVGPALVRSGTSILMVGGYLNNAYTNGVYTVKWPLDASGNPTTGTVSHINLPVNLGYTSAAVLNGRLIVMGGAYYNTTTPAWSYYDNVYRTTLVSDLPSTAWTADDRLVYAYSYNVLTTGTVDGVSVSRMYLFGGWNASQNIGSVQTSLITNSTGDAAPWSVFGNLTSPRYGYCSQVLNGKCHLLGGYGLPGPGQTVTYLRGTEYTNINTDGTLDPAVVGPLLTRTRCYATSQVVTSSTGVRYLYVFGGEGGTSPYLDTVERSQVNSVGNLGAFAIVRPTLMQPRRGAASAILGSFVYLFGGENTGTTKLTSIERAAIATDGSIGNFQQVSAVSLPEPRSFMSSTVVDSTVFLVGGRVGASTSGSSDVLSATMTPDGLGSFKRLPALPVAVYAAPMAQIGSYLYVFGGYTGSANVSTTYRAFIRYDYTLDPWELVQPGGANILQTSTSHLDRPFIVGNWLILAGGYSGSSYNNLIQQAYIQ